MLRKGALYHVTARADHRDTILDHKAIKGLFLSVLARARKKYDFELVNFCIMGSHVHLMIRPAESECLSDIMRWILSVFAMAYNRRMRKTGHVWGQRFFSRIVLGFSGFLGVFKYLDRNPVEAGCVNYARSWRYGGLWMDRLGSRDFHSGLPAWLRLLFPEHAPLLLEGIDFR